MVQVASPAVGLDLPDAREEDLLAQALDWWVETIQARWPGAKAMWTPSGWRQQLQQQPQAAAVDNPTHERTQAR